MEIIERITLADILAAKPQTIYCAVKTCWWTHDPQHLSATQVTERDIERTAENLLLNSLSPNSHRTRAEAIERARRAHSTGLPCDPRGSVLMQVDDFERFLAAAESNPAHHGKHGLRAFLAAHHQNCVLDLETMRPWSGRTWYEYNDALDRLDARLDKQPATAQVTLITDRNHLQTCYACGADKFLPTDERWIFICAECRCLNRHADGRWNEYQSDEAEK